MPNASQAVIIYSSGQLSADVVLTGNVKDGELKNADMSASAAIAYSKLSLALSIVDGDISASAAIAMNKLALSITNNEINASAAIADTKLAQITTASKVSGAALTSLSSIPAGAGTIPAANLSGGITLLYSHGGSDTSAGATTVDSFALSSLTAKDTLIIELIMESATQGTSTPEIFSVTDSLTLMQIIGGNVLAADTACKARLELNQEPQSNTRYFTQCQSGSTAGVASGNNTRTVRAVIDQSAAATTAWTGSWTIGLKHGGVTAGGTFRWQMAIYKLAGQ